MGRPFVQERAAPLKRTATTLLTNEPSKDAAAPPRKKSRLRCLLLKGDSRTKFTFPPKGLDLPTPLSFPPISAYDRRSSQSSVSTSTSTSTSTSSASSSSSSASSSPSLSASKLGSRKRLRDLCRDDTTSRKKRRLRLTLITSRLSLPFSQPPTHIIDKGSSRIAVWAKQKALGRGALLKVAVMNWVRMKYGKVVGNNDNGNDGGDDAGGGPVRSPNADFATPDIRRRIGVGGSQCVAQIPKRDYVPPPPSPLGLSNYDALDLEDDFHDSYNDDEGEVGVDNLVDWSGGAGHDSDDVYADWNIRDPTDTIDPDAEGPHVPELDFFGAVTLPPEVMVERRPPSPPDEKMAEMLKEKERQREVLGVALKFF